MKNHLAALGFAGSLLVSGVANSASFNLNVNALSNCFDIRSRSIPNLASYPISNGRYVVDMTSTSARYCGSECPVPKVMIYVTTNDRPQGWFNQVEFGHPIVIDVTGNGTDANIVYAFYIDITCAPDNTGASVLSFRTVM